MTIPEKPRNRPSLVPTHSVQISSKSLDTIKRKNLMTDCNKSCQVYSCANPTANRTRYCRNHLESNQRHGHPLAKGLPRTDYAKELEEVTSLINNNLSNKGIARTLAVLDSWLAEAVERHDFLGTHEARRLVIAGITARDILIEAIAVYAYSTRHPEFYLSDDALTFQVTNAVLRLAPRPLTVAGSSGKPYRKPATTNVIRGIGFHLRSLLDPLYALITHGKQPTSEPERKPLGKFMTFFKNLGLGRISYV